MDIMQIMDLLPHRYPFLMVDRIIDLEPGKKAVGLKNLTINEPYFAGHFPGQPVMPGVLMIESMAQVGACALLSDSKFRGRMAFLAGVNEFRVKKMAIPGDIMVITAEITRVIGHIGKGKGSITVNNEPVCSGEFLFALDQGEERIRC